MPAPIGNQYAKGCRTSGAPRTVSPPVGELAELGIEMIEWVKINNPIHLSMWWGGQKFILESVWRAMCECKEFLPYYEEALRLVGYNYLFQDSGIEPSIKQRWLRVYFKDLKRNEDETARFNADLRKDEKEAVSNLSDLKNSCEKNEITQHDDNQ